MKPTFFFNTTRPIRKKDLAKVAELHYNRITAWCKWAEPELRKTGYKRSNKYLTPEQIQIIVKWARFKYMVMQFDELDNGELILKPVDKRLFANRFLFPRIPH